MLITFKNMSHKVSFIFCQVTTQNCDARENNNNNNNNSSVECVWNVAAGYCSPLWKPCLSHALRSSIMPVESQLTLWLVCLKSHNRGPSLRDRTAAEHAHTCAQMSHAASSSHRCWTDLRLLIETVDVREGRQNYVSSFLIELGPHCSCQIPGLDSLDLLLPG